MNKDLKKRIKEKQRLWFKLKYVSRNNVGNRTELKEQYRPVSKKLKTDIIKYYFCAQSILCAFYTGAHNTPQIK